MRPEDTTPPNRGPIEPPQRPQDAQRAAVASMTREQLDAIYQQQAAHDASLPETSAPDPQTHHTAYSRTHTDQHSVAPDQWKQYHSQWQQYYQTYYERYYVGAVHQAQQTYQEHAQKLQETTISGNAEHADDIIDKDEAMYDLRQQLLGKVTASAKKVRKSRHFIPAISATLVLLVFVFLQYNAIIFAYAQAYVAPGSVDPQNIIVDPNLSTTVSKDPRLVIPKINVDVPVDYNAKPDYNSQMAAMKSATAYFGVAGADSKPGQLGNVPIAGHSSNDFTDTGSVKFIFSRLDQLKPGDTFYLNYQGTRYTYSVTGSEIVQPTQVSKLAIGTTKAMATLITCTPLGTSTNRLLVFGEQISPSPSSDKPAPGETSSTSDITEMAGKSPTLIERIFGAH